MIKKITWSLFVLLAVNLCYGTTHVLAITVNPITGETFKITATRGTMYNSSTEEMHFFGEVSFVRSCLDFYPTNPNDTLDGIKISCNATRIWVSQGARGEYIDIEDQKCGPSKNLNLVAGGEPILKCLGFNNTLCRATLSGSHGLLVYRGWENIIPHVKDTDEVILLIVDWTVAMQSLG